MPFQKYTVHWGFLTCTAAVISGVVTASTFESTRVHPMDFGWVHFTQSLVFCVVFCRSLFVFLYFFLLGIVLSVLQFMASDYSWSIFSVKMLLLQPCTLMEEEEEVYLLLISIIEMKSNRFF